MAWEFNNNEPIYRQLLDQLKLRIISGVIGTGSKLDSVRDLAQDAGVNPNTMQRALAELEREELVFSQRTSGRFVTEDKELIQRLRNEYAHEKVRELTTSLLQLGYTRKELIELINGFLEEVS
ncbi:GntR family transcriptional regulator [Cellulosilyticum ruminicola]|uniref:GntR family transcriptional regulator n=1 Tax=Cellulosilyticum ruminicola TaxID=425254 RepID=UPI0006D161DB|nr:GntR family transcriptional regulator [Cellulosilyticum ruminicola]